ncbi:CST, telomere maintenance, complex subunit CTC1-domain-containing protein [Mycotypha africana]|uniref:CST, telomere maintenance, complex subunit CTC1-domain-containing protein n=1 Tax=Mycotypha africana TaxID=64632 RepID=UPI0022FFE56B|nr:CST, telomere maintenance, complex subunit CTC1-domain-containing protein [Mycotypha africana]KAI8975709.1 CST, telomere maintenance, complex subunit CTC1-domain-containing protein [Mycotypha africana]
MNPLRVNDLLQLKFSTNSAIGGHTLIGKIIIVEDENDEYARGSVLLQDPSTSGIIACNVDRCLPHLNNAVVQITEWTYIYHESSGIQYLEFMLDRIYRNLTTVLDKNRNNSALSVFREHLEFDNYNFESALTFGLPYYTPSTIINVTELIEERAHINISGVIEAKSALYTRSASDAFFFVQITDIADRFVSDEKKGETAATTTAKKPIVTILFQGNHLIKYYHSFTVGWAYSYQKLLKDKETLSFVEYQSSSHHITLKQFANLSLLSSHLPPAVSASQQLLSSEVPTIKQPLDIFYVSADSNISAKSIYTITRVIDSTFGIYELNNKYTLCLFHHSNYQRARPYRCQTRIRLHYIHLVSVEPKNNETSSLLDIFWKVPSQRMGRTDNGTTGKEKTAKNYIFIVACMNSNVEIVSFPNHCEYAEFNYKLVDEGLDDEREDSDSQMDSSPRSSSAECQLEKRIKEQIFMHCSGTATINELIFHLELYATLCTRFLHPEHFTVDDVEKICDEFMYNYTAICKALYRKIDTNFVQNLLRHEPCPVIAAERVDDSARLDIFGASNSIFHLVLDTYPSLETIYDRLYASLEKHNVQLMGSNTLFEAADVETKRATFNEKTAGYHILGKLHMQEDGRLYLLDNTMSVLLVVSFLSTVDAAAHSVTYLDGFCIIHQLQFFEEDLSYVRYDKENEGVDGLFLRPPLWHRYIACIKSHIQLLGDSEERKIAPFQFKISPRILQNDIIGGFRVIQATNEVKQFLIKNEDSQVVVVRVIIQQPIKAHVHSEDIPCLESRIIVRIYAVEFSWLKESYISRTRKFARKLRNVDQHALVLSAKCGSLKYSKMMIPNSFWAIYNLNSDSEIEGSFTLDAQKHIICPVTFLPNASQAERKPLMQLFPQFTPTLPNTNQLLTHIYNISDILQEEKLPDKLAARLGKNYKHSVNIQGIIITKRLLDNSIEKNIINDTHALKLYNEYGITSGKGSRQLYLQIRQPDTLDILDIFMELTSVRYPSGLVVGSYVRIFNLARKIKTSNTKLIYGKADSSTYISIISFDPLQTEQQHLLIHNTINTEKVVELPVKQLSSIYYDMFREKELDETNIFRIYGSVKKVWKLESTWQCRHCGTKVLDDECMGSCKTAAKVYSIKLKVEISDGTGSARAYVDGERLATCLLQLSPKHLNALKQATAKQGDIVYDQDSHETYTERIGAAVGYNGFTLQSLCYRAQLVGKVHMFVKIVAGKKENNDDMNRSQQTILEKLGLKKRVIVKDKGAMSTLFMVKKLILKTVDIQTHDEYVKKYQYSHC